MISNRKITWIFILTSVAHFCHAQKTDKVYLSNGDIITGEIKSMKLAMLNYKTDGPGTISIKWEYISGLRSDKIFEITTRSGHVFLDILDSFYLKRHSIKLDDIVEIVQIKNKFLKRLSGNFDLGFNYTKSSNIIQSNFDGNVAYRSPKFEISLSVSSYLTTQNKDSLVTKKQDVTLYCTRDLENRYFLTGGIGWQQNSELGLASRFLLNTAAGRSLLIDNHNRLLAAVGASVNREKSLENDQINNHLDALAFVQYKRFYYSTPKISLDANYYFYPGITEWGRIRMEGNLNTKIEIFKNFNVGLIFYYNYDNIPPSGAASKTDWGISFSVGFEFGK